MSDLEFSSPVEVVRFKWTRLTISLAIAALLGTSCAPKESPQEAATVPTEEPNPSAVTPMILPSGYTPIIHLKA